MVDRFQWAGRMLLRAVTILRCSELIVSAGIRALKEARGLGENIRLLKVKKFSLEKAKQKLTSKVEELKEASSSKN